MAEIDRDKVAKGLKLCVITGDFCGECPYNGMWSCIEKLHDDTLVLLKEQEKRINELEKNLKIDIPLKERNDNFDLYDTPIFGFHD